MKFKLQQLHSSVLTQGGAEKGTDRVYARLDALFNRKKGFLIVFKR
ncbi:MULTISPECIES: hypothetical protein [Bacillus]|nr:MULTISPECIES: hypothetical protein [Bacillus cereus group]OSY11914.1 hypothetical protein BTJ48_01618 [Bacillus mycoides]